VKVRIAPSPLSIPMVVPSAHGPTGLRIDHTVNRSQTRLRHAGQQEGSLRDFDTRVMAVAYQGAVDTMIAYLDAHPETDVHAYADALVELLLNAIRR
jgi:hypothetical protein